ERGEVMATQDPTSKPGGIEFYGGYQVYSESGVDLTLLRRNLQKTPEQRWEDARRGARLLHAFAPGSSGGPAHRRLPMFEPEGIVRQLHEHQVEFVVIGGLAMIAQGSTYLTKDLDLCYNRAAENIAPVAAALAPLPPYLRGVPPGLPFRFDPPTIQAGLNFTLVTDLGDLDLLGEVSGLGPYPQVLAQSEVKPMF